MKRVLSRTEKTYCLPLAGLTLSTALMLSGCGGSTTGLQQPTVSQPVSGVEGRSANAADMGKIDPAALKAPRLGVFLTASKSAAGLSHIWAPIVKVELVDGKAMAQTIWDGGTDGIVVDLSALASGSASSAAGGKFLGIVGAPVNGGSATERIRVTFGKAFELYDTGATVAKTTLFADSVARDSEGHPIISFALNKPRDLGTGKENVVIDVDLSGLNVKDDKLTPTLREGDLAGLKESSRLVETTYSGTISGISNEAPAVKFVLASDQTASPATIVQAGTATAYFNDTSASSPALADKQRVRVRGVLSPESKRIVASEITAFSGEKVATNSSALTGNATHVNAEDRTFVIDASQIEGLTPTQATITVSLAADAVLRSRGGLPIKGDEFWSALKAKDGSGLVRVDGTYDPVTSTLTATRAKFENATPPATHEADAQGEPKFVDIGAKTFSLAAPLVKWDGIAQPDDKEKGLPVTVTAATVFTDQSGDSLTPAKFYDAAIKDKDKIVRVVGLYGAKGLLTATKVVLMPRPSAGAGLASASPAPSTSPAAVASPAASAAVVPAAAAQPAPGSANEPLPTPAATAAFSGSK